MQTDQLKLIEEAVKASTASAEIVAALREQVKRLGECALDD
jgi:hypothetical protein